MGEDKTKPDRQPLGPVTRYFDMLANRHCRYTLYYLREQQDDPISIELVARHVIAFETEYAPDTLVEADYAAVQHELSHTHLPRLDDYGIIDFDHRNRVVHLQPLPPILRGLLWVSYRLERPG